MREAVCPPVLGGLCLCKLASCVQMQHKNTAGTAHAAVEVQLELHEDSLAWSPHLGTEGSALGASLLSLGSDISSIGSAVQRFDSDEGATAVISLPAASLLRISITGEGNKDFTSMMRDISSITSGFLCYHKFQIESAEVSSLFYRQLCFCNPGAPSSTNCVRGHQANSTGSASWGRESQGWLYDVLPPVD